MSREIVSNENKLGGKPYLENTRVRVSDIAIKYEELGYTVEDILEAYRRLDEEDIEKALSYYYRNRERFRQNQLDWVN